MSKDYQSINRFIKDGVKQLKAPFKLDDDLLDICQETYDNDYKHLKPRELSRILKEANLIMERAYQRYYSTESITQITEQIINIRNEQVLDDEEFLQFFKDLDLPINLQSDYKIYSLGDLIQQILTLPEIDTSTSRGVLSNTKKTKYQEYNDRRIALIEKIQKIQQYQKDTELLKSYNDLLSTKLDGADGFSSNIRKNTLHKNNEELSNEITKLKINLQRYQTFNESKKDKFQKILKNEYL